MEVSQLNESLANMSRTCDNLKLEIARIYKQKDNKEQTLKHKSVFRGLDAKRLSKAFVVCSSCSVEAD